MRDYAFLESRGWRVIVVWECELTAAALPETVERVYKGLMENRKSWMEEMADRRRRREEWREVIRGRKEREKYFMESIRQ